MMAQIRTSRRYHREGVILYFYPRDNTPGCTSQACDFRDNFGGFRTVHGKLLESLQTQQNHIKISSQNMDFLSI